MGIRLDPGPCPICGAAHTACTADAGPVVISQLPARDGVEAGPVTAPARPLAGEVRQGTLPPGEFTSATYRGKGKRK